MQINLFNPNVNGVNWVDIGIYEREAIMQIFTLLMPLWIALFLLSLLMLALIIVALISLSKKAVPWQDKILWLIIILAIANIGPIVYLIIGSQILDDKIKENQENDLTWTKFKRRI